MLRSEATISDSAEEDPSVFRWLSLRGIYAHTLLYRYASTFGYSGATTADHPAWHMGFWISQFRVSGFDIESVGLILGYLGLGYCSGAGVPSCTCHP
jgi:hypothetical protein